MFPQVPVTSLKHYRVLVVGYCVLLACLGVMVVDRVMRGQWWWLIGTVVVMVWTVSKLVTAVRQRRPGSATQQAARARAADEASAQAEWTPPRLRGLAADRGLDLGTSAGRITLIRALRELDDRLGLVAAKDLVDRAL